jgi:hypothetical protein
MKERDFILDYDPCGGLAANPDIQSFEDAMRQAAIGCPYAAVADECSPLRFGCIREAGARMARHVIQFCTEASDESLSLARDFFRLRGPLPPTAVEAYVDPDRGFELLTDPEEVVQRVWEYARAVLDLKPGERVPRPVGRYLAPAGVPVMLLRARGASRQATATRSVWSR